MWERASSAERSNERFAERRRLRRRRALATLAIFIGIMFGALVYGLHRPEVRISHVDIFNGDPALASLALADMHGSYLGLIPRDSILFFPVDQIRSDILKSHNDIAAVSIVRSSLTSISIKINSRVPIARWCAAPDSDCYLFDASGFIYTATTTIPLVNSFVLYEPLGASSSPIGLTLPNADKLPSAFDFARQLATLGSAVEKIVIRDGEVDDYLNSGTRVTYLLGHEDDAFTALVSARDNLNLSDSSIDYVDLRFGSKVYLKKK